MKLIGIFSVFDDEVEMLMDSIADLDRLGVTDLIVVDGPYENFPHKRVDSPHWKIDWIVRACASREISLTLQRMPVAWKGDEIAKRQRLLDLTHVVAGDEESWLCIWDADFSLAEFKVSDDTHLDGLFDIKGCIDNWPGEIKGINVNVTDNPSRFPSAASWSPIKMFIRFVPGMRMGSKHYEYVYPDGSSLWFQPLRPEDDAFLAPIYVQHMKHKRSQSRLDAQRIYYERRDGQKLEG